MMKRNLNVMKIIVLGANGMLGFDLVKHLNEVEFGNDVQLVNVDRDDVDISNKVQTRHFVEQHNPDVIINCAAYTDVDGCEENYEMAYSVNATGVMNVASAAKECGSKVVHISTDYVFDGSSRNVYTEESPVNPLSVYGKSKLKGEEHLQGILSDFIIIRTAWLYGGKNYKNYVQTMLGLGEKLEELNVVVDQIGSPTFTADLAKAVYLLVKGGHTGIFHVTNSDSCSRLEWSRKIFEISGTKIKLKPVTSDKFPRPASVPAHAILSCEKFNSVTGVQMRRWDEALVDYMKMIR